MALKIDTFNDLVREIKTWSDRKDITDDQVSSFVYMAGSMANQLLRVPAMEWTELLTVEDGHVIVPFDFLELRSMTAATGSDTSVPLERVSMETFVNYHNRLLPDGQAVYFTRQGPYWFLAPAPADGSKVTCHYYRNFPDLDATFQTNWLIDVSPMAYLFGSLHYLYLFFMDDDKAEYWRQKFEGEIARIQTIADRSEHSGTRLTVREKDL